MMERYILDGKTPVLCRDLTQWALWFEHYDRRRVAQDMIGGVRVSTVFLGLDHRFGSGPPLLFETMIFGGAHDQHCKRTSTWDEAEKLHAETVAFIKSTDPEC